MLERMEPMLARTKLLYTYITDPATNKAIAGNKEFHSDKRHQTHTRVPTFHSLLKARTVRPVARKVRLLGIRIRLRASSCRL